MGFSNKNIEYVIVGIGEILWDILPDGKILGGAPTNFAYHVANIGHKGIIISAVGKDPLGDEIIKTIARNNLSRDYIQVKSRKKTGRVEVEIVNKFKPHYIIHKNVAWDFIKFDNKLELLAKKVDAVCFGSLAQRSLVSRYTIKRFVESVNNNTVKVFDVNLRQNYYSRPIIINSMKLCSILKFNEEELSIIINMLNLEKKKNEKDYCKLIIDEYDLKLMCLTKGKNGSLIMDRSDYFYYTGNRINIVDTVGAGDAFTAAMVIQYLNGENLEEISRSANFLGSWVASKRGPTPTYSKEILHKVF